MVRVRDSWLLCYYCVTDVLLLWMFCGSSSVLNLLFQTMELTILSQFMCLSIESPRYLTLSWALITCSLHFTLKFVMFIFVAVFLGCTSTGRVDLCFLWFYVQELPKAQLVVVLVLKRLRRRGNGLKSHPTDWEKPGIEPATPGLQDIGLSPTMFLSFLRGQKGAHSVLATCKNNLLSTSKFVHDSITSDNFVTLWANSMGIASA